jgi:hypothetical protein
MYINDLREAYADRYDLKRIGTACARGMKQLVPGLTHGISHKWLMPPYETQGFDYATKSYDTTVLRVYAFLIFLK